MRKQKYKISSVLKNIKVTFVICYIMLYITHDEKELAEEFASIESQASQIELWLATST